MTLWGCAFEDLVTRVFEPDGRNIVDEYLKRRGWNEAGPNKLYMRALKTSVKELKPAKTLQYWPKNSVTMPAAALRAAISDL